MDKKTAKSTQPKNVAPKKAPAKTASAPKAEKPLDILDILLDDKNTDDIILADEKGKKIRFSQIAVIPYKDKLYTVLKPVDKIDNVADDEAIVFVVEENENGENVLKVETDEETAIAVFDEYYNLVEESEDNGDKK